MPKSYPETSTPRSTLTSCTTSVAVGEESQIECVFLAVRVRQHRLGPRGAPSNLPSPQGRIKP